VKRLPRLTIREFQDLGRACDWLATVNRMLASSNWKGAPACMSLLNQAFPPIASLYNRAEPCVDPKHHPLLASVLQAEAEQLRAAPSSPPILRIVPREE